MVQKDKPQKRKDHLRKVASLLCDEEHFVSFFRMKVPEVLFYFIHFSAHLTVGTSPKYFSSFDLYISEGIEG